MASKAVAKVKADWSKIASQLDKTELPALNKLKSYMDSNSVRVSTLPDSLPKIDWAHYKARASDPKLVEELERQYQAIKVEVPKAPNSRLNDLKRAHEIDEARYQKFVGVSQAYIDSAEKLKVKFEKMIPVPEMTYEDWFATFPEWSSSIENPSIAPHFGRIPGLTREEAAAFDQPDPIPFATKTAWKEWEVKKKKFYT